MDRGFLSWLILLLVLLPCAARADSRATTAALAANADRSPAAGGAAESLDWLERELRIQTGGNAGIYRQKFFLTLPVVGECRAEAMAADAATEPSVPMSLAPLMPMGGQSPSLGTLQAREFPVVYGRAGTLEDLKAELKAKVGPFV